MSSVSKRASKSNPSTSKLADLPATILTPSSKLVLKRYLRGAITLPDLSEWLAVTDYDDELSRDERDALASVRIAVIETEEFGAPDADIAAAIRRLLAG